MRVNWGSAALHSSGQTGILLHQPVSGLLLLRICFHELFSSNIHQVRGRSHLSFHSWSAVTPHRGCQERCMLSLELESFCVSPRLLRTLFVSFGSVLTWVSSYYQQCINHGEEFYTVSYTNRVATTMQKQRSSYSTCRFGLYKTLKWLFLKCCVVSDNLTFYAAFRLKCSIQTKMQYSD